MQDITKFDPKQIREVIHGWPPMVWMKDGLVHCVTDSPLLIRTFCEINRIPMTVRFDAWSAFSEPFLDTEFSERSKQITDQSLKENGFSAEEIESIRDKIKGPMLRLTAITWEWVHYGLEDVRQAMGLSLLDKLFGKSKEHMAWTSEIATRPWIREIQSGTPTRIWPEYNFPVLGLNNRLSFLPKLMGKSSPVVDPEQGQDMIFAAALDDMSSPNRTYHNQRHLEEAFDQGTLSYRNLKKFTTRSSLVESDNYKYLCWSLLFHDSVYNPGQSNNENLSAQRAIEMMGKVGWSTASQSEVTKLILWTQKHRLSEVVNDELKAMHDGDLGIFGLWPSRYEQYCAGVKDEWLCGRNFTEAQFHNGRLNFLLRFAEEHNHPNFYYALDPLHNQLAHKNIQHEIEQLKAKMS